VAVARVAEVEGDLGDVEASVMQRVESQPHAQSVTKGRNRVAGDFAKRPAELKWRAASARCEASQALV